MASVLIGVDRAVFLSIGVQMMPCALSRLMYMNASLLPLSVPTQPGSLCRLPRESRSSLASSPFVYICGCSITSPHRSAEGCIDDNVSAGITPDEAFGASRYAGKRLRSCEVKSGDVGGSVFRGRYSAC